MKRYEVYSMDPSLRYMPEMKWNGVFRPSKLQTIKKKLVAIENHWVHKGWLL
jgi:hypothetical protein